MVFRKQGARDQAEYFSFILGRCINDEEFFRTLKNQMYARKNTRRRMNKECFKYKNYHLWKNNEIAISHFIVIYNTSLINVFLPEKLFLDTLFSQPSHNNNAFYLKINILFLQE